MSEPTDLDQLFALLSAAGAKSADQVLKAEMAKWTYMGGKRVSILPLPNKREDAPTTVHRVKATLYGSKPPIWRRLDIPSNTTLDLVHETMLIAFDWFGMHLHSFETPYGTFGLPDSDDFDEPTLNERKASLGQVAGERGGGERMSRGTGDDDTDQRMSAFREALARMDNDPAEAARIRDLADKTDAEIAPARARVPVRVGGGTTPSPVPAHGQIVSYEPLLSPVGLLQDLPLNDEAASSVQRARIEVRAVLDGIDDRLLVIAGPSVIHDPELALGYASLIAALRDRFQDDLLIVMRVYLQRSHIDGGWTGLLDDPAMDGSNDVHRGLRTGRRLLIGIVSEGTPTACEWLDPITPQYIGDTVAWGAIGAGRTQSHVHTQLASALAMPIGFENDSNGDVQAAIDACRSAASSHTFFGVTAMGSAAVITTNGNPDTHVILRGGHSVVSALDQITAAGLPRRLVVDVGHRTEVAKLLAEQISTGERGVRGVALTSFLADNQSMDLDTTASVLAELASAVRRRRT
jgi:3-deoxy-7-phosphoheptulonate synthase